MFGEDVDITDEVDDEDELACYLFDAVMAGETWCCLCDVTSRCYTPYVILFFIESYFVAPHIDCIIFYTEGENCDTFKNYC